MLLQVLLKLEISLLNDMITGLYLTWGFEVLEGDTPFITGIFENCSLPISFQNFPCIFQYFFSFHILDSFILWLGCWIPSPGVPGSKPLNSSKADSAFHPSKADQMSTRTS